MDKIFILIIITLIISLDGFGDEELSGELIWKNGTTSIFTSLNINEHSGEILTFSTFEKYPIIRMAGPYLKIAKVERIDLIDLSDDEKQMAKDKKITTFPESFLTKANVTFIDGTKENSIFLYRISPISWGNEKEHGIVSTQDFQSIVFNHKEFVKCNKCGIKFTQTLYKFCPFDGTPLDSEIVPTEILDATVGLYSKPCKVLICSEGWGWTIDFEKNIRLIPWSATTGWSNQQHFENSNTRISYDRDKSGQNFEPLTANHQDIHFS